MFFCTGCGLFVRFNVPETRNRTVLEIAAEYDRMHRKTEESQREKNNEQTLNGINAYETKL